MLITILKSLHIIGFVAWFGGLFYLVRIFVYHAESFDKANPEKDILHQQYQLMEKRAYTIICRPAMIFTWICGIGMLVANTGYFQQGWIHVKLLLLLLLVGYHHYCGGLIKKLAKGSSPLASFQLRLLNEVPTLFLAAIVFVAVLGKAGILNYLYLGLGIGGFAALMYFGARAYRKKREQG